MMPKLRPGRSELAPQREVYIDVLNILAALLVVWIHFAPEVHWYDGSKAWYWCLIIQAVAYWTVPMFLMLSGATLIGYHKRYDTATFFRKRLLRTLLPYLFWGTVFLLIKVKQGEIQFVLDGNLNQFLFSLSDVYVHNQMEDVYWFFPLLFGIYLSMPFLTVLAEEQNKKRLTYLVVAGILTISVIPFLYSMAEEYLNLSGLGWNAHLELPVLGGYLIYPVLGYWAANRDFKKVERILLYIAAILGAVMRYCGMRTLTERDGEFNQLYINNMCFPVLFLTLGIFVFVRYLCLRHENLFARAARVLSQLSGCSLGVYLIHKLVIDWMEPIPFFDRYTLQWYYFWPFVCYIFCVAVVFVGRKLPLVRRLLP